MVMDMRKFAVPFDAQYYDDWVFTVPPEGFASSTEEEQQPATAIAVPQLSFSETVAAIGEPTPDEVKLLEKKGISSAKKTEHWKQYVDRVVKKKTTSFQYQLQNKGASACAAGVGSAFCSLVLISNS